MSRLKPPVFFFLIAVLGSLAFTSSNWFVLKPSKNVRVLHQPTDTIKPASKLPKFQWLDFESGFLKAKKENKILLVDVYTDWCYYCKVMDKETYTNDSVIRMLKQDFVMVKLNPEKNRNYVMNGDTMDAVTLHKWLGYGKQFGYPTSYFMVNPGETEERYALIGYVQSWDFMNVLEQIRAKKKKVK